MINVMLSLVERAKRVTTPGPGLSAGRGVGIKVASVLLERLETLTHRS